MTGLRSPARVGQAVAIAMVLTGLILALRAADTPTPVPAGTEPPRSEPTLESALDRCRFDGAAGGADPTCQTAWAESRDRFFSTSGQGDRP